MGCLASCRAATGGAGNGVVYRNRAGDARGAKPHCNGRPGAAILPPVRLWTGKVMGRILVTGGSGRLGRSIVARLAAEHALRILDLAPGAPEVPLIKGSVL